MIVDQSVHAKKVLLYATAAPSSGSILTSLYYPVINWEPPITIFVIFSWYANCSTNNRVNKHTFKQTTMAYGHHYSCDFWQNCQFSTLCNFHKWHSKSNNTSKYYAIPCNHELPSIPNPCNTIDNNWITLNTKGGGSTSLGLCYYSNKVDIHLNLLQ